MARNRSSHRFSPSKAIATAPLATSIRDRTREQVFKILNTISDACIFFDNDGRYLFLNSKALKILNVKKKDLIGKRISEVFPYVNGHPALIVFEQVLKSRKFQEYVYYSEKAGRWLQTLYYPTKAGITVIYRDIHEDMLARELQKQEEQKYQRIIDKAPDVIYFIDANGNIRSLSPSFKRLTGWPVKKWIGKNIAELIHPDDRELAIFKCKETLNNVNVQCVLRVLTRFGSYKIGDFHGAPYMDGNTILGTIGIARDITDKKNLDVKLKYQIARQKAVNQFAIQALKTDKIEKLSQRAIAVIYEQIRVPFIRITRYDKLDNALTVIAQKGWDSLLPIGEQINIENSLAGAALSQSVPVTFEEMYQHNKNEIEPALKKAGIVSGVSIAVPGTGGPFGTLGIHTTQGFIVEKQDIVFLQSIIHILGSAIQRIQNDQMIKHSEKRFRTLIEKSTDAFRMVDRTGKVIYVSPSIRSVLGYTATEYINLNVFDQLHPEDKNAYKASFEKGLHAPGRAVHLTYRMKHKDGTWRWLEGVGRNLLEDPGVRAFVSNFRDVTDRIKIEHELRSSRDRLRMAVSAAQLGMWHIDYSNNTIKLNRQLRKQLGIPAKIELNPEDLKKYMDEKDYQKLQAAFRDSLNNQGKYEVVFRIHDTVRNTYRWIQAYGRVYYNEFQTPYFIDGITIDVTQTKEMDQKKNEFITMASHELKTPITSLKLFADMLQRQINTKDPKELMKFVNGIRNQADTLRDLINDLLDVSRIETGKLNLQKTSFSIDELIENTLAGLEGISPKHKLHFKKYGAMSVLGDRFRIYQVITNMITNAIKYSPQGDRVEISLRKKGIFAEIAIKDFGIGIPKGHQKKIFEKLYQVTDGNVRAHTGLGMGLYICQEIIKQHHGSLRVHSMPGKGSTFYILLPLD